MELVARELKAMGVYTARALSYAGVEYDILEHELTPGQIRDFDTYADAWAIIHRNMEEALAAASVVDRLTGARSEEHTSELQSLMRSSYAVFCLKKKNKHIHQQRRPKHKTHEKI